MQVEIYFPNVASSQFGIVRTYENDGNTTDNGSNGFIFVDSDGMVALDARAIQQSGSTAATDRIAPINVMNGLWHMVTLTSQQNGQKGYRCVHAGFIYPVAVDIPASLSIEEHVRPCCA